MNAESAETGSQSWPCHCLTVKLLVNDLTFVNLRLSLAICETRQYLPARLLGGAADLVHEGSAC